MQSTWSFWAAVWACPGCNWQFLPVFLLMFQFFLQLLILEFHVLQHFLGELTCVMFQYWFRWEAATVWVEKCSKNLWAEWEIGSPVWMKTSQAMLQDTVVVRQQPDLNINLVHQLVCSDLASFSVFPVALLKYTGARSKPLFQFWYILDLHILNKEGNWAASHCYSVGKIVIFIFKLIQLVAISLHTLSVIKWWLCWEHWNHMHHSEAMPLSFWLFITEAKT